MWYELLLQEPYFSYICSEDFRADSPLFRAFRDRVVDGITMGNLILQLGGEDFRKRALDSLKDADSAPVCREYIRLTEGRAVDFGTLLRKGQAFHQPHQYEKMPAEELAVRILYPFWSRVGGSFETAFAESGELRRLLTHLSACGRAPVERLSEG